MTIRRLRRLQICPLVKTYKRRIASRKKEERKMQRYREDPEYREKIKAKNRKIYDRDPGKANKRRTQLRQKDKERANEYSRKYYHANRERIAGQVLRARERRDPIIGIYTAILAYSNGSGGFDEVTRRIEDADKRINDQIKRFVSAQR